MTTQKLAVAKAEHTSWRAMLDALKAAGYITEDDLRARTSDRSSPQRSWIADSLAWLSGKATENMVANDDPHWLRNRFKQLFPGEIVLTRFEQWVADAEMLRDLREAQAV